MNQFQILIRKADKQGWQEFVPTPSVITFMQPLPMMVGDADQVLQVSSTNAEVPIVVISADESAAIIVNGALHALKSGNVVLTATQVSGGNYLAATPVTKTVSLSAIVTPPPVMGEYTYVEEGDSRTGYPGDTGTEDETSVTALMAKRFRDAGIDNVTFKRFSYPGATAEQVDDPSYTNSLQYACNKPQGVSSTDYILSTLDAAKTNVVSIAFGANVGQNDIEAIKAKVAKYKASGKVAKVFVELVLPRLNVNFDNINAAIREGAGDWHDGYSPIDSVPQLFSPEAVENPTVFWKQDFVYLSGVHLTTKGNQLKSEADAQFFAKSIGFTLPPLVPEMIDNALEQDSLYISYSPANAWNSYKFDINYANFFAGYSTNANAKVSIKAKFYGVQYVSSKNNKGADVELWIDGVKVDEGTTFASSTFESRPVLQKVFTTLAERTVEVRRKAGTNQLGMYSDQFRFANSAGVFPLPAPEHVMVPIPDHSDGSVETVIGIIATTNNSAGSWNSGVHMDTFAAPTGSSAVKVRVGALSTHSAVVLGIAPAGDNNSSPKYNGLAKSVYFDLNNIAGFKNGSVQGAIIARDKNRVNDIWFIVYADRIDLFTNLSSIPLTSFYGTNTAMLQVFAALQDDKARLEAATISMLS